MNSSNASNSAAMPSHSKPKRRRGKRRRASVETTQRYSLQRIFFAMMPHSTERALAHQYDAIVAQLRAARQVADLTQEQLEAKIGLTKGHIDKLERKERLARADLLMLWAVSLGFNVTLTPNGNAAK